jgi:hypothetical protein
MDAMSAGMKAFLSERRWLFILTGYCRQRRQGQVQEPEVARFS